MSALPVLLLATRNSHKTAEIAQILGSRFHVQDLNAHPAAPEVEETGDTFEANAALKACAGSFFSGGWALADDSGLEVDALHGAPGVRSARYSGEGATDAKNNALLLANLLPFRGKERRARFRCVLALAKRGELIATFDGSVEGIIVNEVKGTGGFGYDPLFVPDGYCETFGTLSADVKNSISHRSRALRRFSAWLEANPVLE
jgi:XTP/dITP diphosphohydrolase